MNFTKPKIPKGITKVREKWNDWHLWQAVNQKEALRHTDAIIVLYNFLLFYKLFSSKFIVNPKKNHVRSLVESFNLV